MQLPLPTVFALFIIWGNVFNTWESFMLPIIWYLARACGPQVSHVRFSVMGEQIQFCTSMLSQKEVKGLWLGLKNLCSFSQVAKAA
jgi:hypothetical protein